MMCTDHVPESPCVCLNLCEHMCMTRVHSLPPPFVSAQCPSHSPSPCVHARVECSNSGGSHVLLEMQRCKRRAVQVECRLDDRRNLHM